MKFRPLHGSRGFSLLEILVVLAIIGIMAAIAIPLMKPASRAGQIKSTADQLKSELLLARQQAITLNASMEVRFFQETSTSPFTAYQIFNIKDDKTVEPFSKLVVLSKGLVLPADADLCPLLTETLLKGTQTDGPPAVQNWNYAAFDIHSSGGLPDVNQDKSFVTLLEDTAPKVSGKLPSNYAVIQIQPVTGMVSVTQP